MKAPTDPRVLSVAQAAELIGVSERSMWNWLNDPEHPLAGCARRIGARTLRVSRTALDRYMHEAVGE